MGVARRLTEMQRRFAELVIFGGPDGPLTGTEAAKIAGYSEKRARQEAEGETTIVKGIGMNSPEMEALQARVKELDNSLSIALEINENHQRYNGKLQTRVTDLEEDNKKLARQVEDLKLNGVRKAGL